MKVRMARSRSVGIISKDQAYNDPLCGRSHSYTSTSLTDVAAVKLFVAYAVMRTTPQVETVLLQ